MLIIHLSKEVNFKGVLSWDICNSPAVRENLIRRAYKFQEKTHGILVSLILKTTIKLVIEQNNIIFMNFEIVKKSILHS